jgi:hypothetical protein
MDPDAWVVQPPKRAAPLPCWRDGFGPMVYDPAEQQGGYLDLVNDVDQGTAVSLYFPRAAD